MPAGWGWRGVRTAATPTCGTPTPASSSSTTGSSTPPSCDNVADDPDVRARSAQELGRRTACSRLQRRAVQRTFGPSLLAPGRSTYGGTAQALGTREITMRTLPAHARRRPRRRPRSPACWRRRRPRPRPPPPAAERLSPAHEVPARRRSRSPTTSARSTTADAPRNDCLQKYAVGTRAGWRAPRDHGPPAPGPIMRDCGLGRSRENIADGYPTGAAVVATGGWARPRAPGEHPEPELPADGRSLPARATTAHWYAAQVFGRRS